MTNDVKSFRYTTKTLFLHWKGGHTETLNVGKEVKGLSQSIEIEKTKKNRRRSENRDPMPAVTL